jgi:hypothetical protein
MRSARARARGARCFPSAQNREKAAARQQALLANAPHGEKGGYVKVTVTLPPEVYELLANEATRRKVHKEANPQLIRGIRGGGGGLFCGDSDSDAEALALRAQHSPAAAKSNSFSPLV